MSARILKFPFPDSMPREHPPPEFVERLHRSVDFDAPFDGIDVGTIVYDDEVTEPSGVWPTFPIPR